MDRFDVIALLIALLVWTIPLAILHATHLPPTAKIPTHWGINGKPNGWTTAKDIPALVATLAEITIVVWVIRFVYPRQENVRKFSRAYNALVIGFSAILALILSTAILQTSGYRINANAVTMVGVGAIISVAGAVTFVSKQNWAVGIRTPWGLESEEAWEVSNRIGGTALIIGGVLVALSGIGIVSPVVGLVIILAGFIAAAVSAYVVWRRER